MAKRIARNFTLAGMALSAMLIANGCRSNEAGGSASKAGKQPGATISMRFKPSLFVPAKVTVSPGETILWANDSPYPHAVIADDGASPGGPNSMKDFPHGILGGESWSWTVPKDAKPGTRWIYHCQYHGEPGDGMKPGFGMTGILVVR